MAHVAITRNGNEALFRNRPKIKEGNLSWAGEMILLPPGSIKKLTGKDLKFGDEPIELQGDESNNIEPRAKQRQ